MELYSLIQSDSRRYCISSHLPQGTLSFLDSNRGILPTSGHSLSRSPSSCLFGEGESHTGARRLPLRVVDDVLSILVVNIHVKLLLVARFDLRSSERCENGEVIVNWAGSLYLQCQTWLDGACHYIISQIDCLVCMSPLSADP